MDRRQFILLLVVIAVAGLLGGALSEHLFGGRQAWGMAQPASAAQQVIKAGAFEVVDEKGRVRARMALPYRPESRAGHEAGTRAEKEAAQRRAHHHQSHLPHRPALAVYDQAGNIVWYAPPRVEARLLEH